MPPENDVPLLGQHVRPEFCPGCGAPAGYPQAGPCLNHGTMQAKADVSCECPTPRRWIPGHVCIARES